MASPRKPTSGSPDVPQAISQALSQTGEAVAGDSQPDLPHRAVVGIEMRKGENSGI